MIRKETRIIKASLCDTQLNTSIISIFNIIQDAITDLMTDLKIDGLTTSKKYNAVWVFSKNKVNFFQDIKWNSKIDVHCFISSVTSAKLILDTAIYCNGSLAAYSKAEACAIDKNTGFIKRTNSVGIDENFEIENSLCDIEFKKHFLNPEEFSVKGTAIVNYTNLDYLHHTNNVEYLRILFNTFSTEEMENKKIKEFEIIYKNQSFINDKLTILTFNKNNSVFYQIKAEDKIIVEGEILY